MRIILDSPLKNMCQLDLTCDSIVGISKNFFDYAHEAMKRNPKNEFIKIAVCIVREPENGNIAFDFTPNDN